MGGLWLGAGPVNSIGYATAASACDMFSSSHGAIGFISANCRGSGSHGATAFSTTDGIAATGMMGLGGGGGGAAGCDDCAACSMAANRFETSASLLRSSSAVARCKAMAARRLHALI